MHRNSSAPGFADGPDLTVHCPDGTIYVGLSKSTLDSLNNPPPSPLAGSLQLGFLMHGVEESFGHAALLDRAYKTNRTRFFFGVGLEVLYFIIAFILIELGIPVTDFQPGHTPVTTLWLLLHFALALLVDSIGVAAAIRKADRTLLFFIILHGGFVVFYARESPFFTWFFLALRVFTILLALILRATIVAVNRHSHYTVHLLRRRLDTARRAQQLLAGLNRLMSVREAQLGVITEPGSGRRASGRRARRSSASAASTPPVPVDTDSDSGPDEGGSSAEASLANVATGQTAVMSFGAQAV